MTTYTIEIVQYDDDKVVKRIACGANERKAARIDNGIQHNLNHDKFFTQITEHENE